MKRIRNEKNDMYDLADIKSYMTMPAKDKLDWLRDTAGFLQKITPAGSKKIWEKLKNKGF
ncbi:MAG: hypothetical protein KKH28_01830 [Elusimicrobia bacterium]|nr:hypothetical protein [Elusimicrobiota bacterium]